MKIFTQAEINKEYPNFVSYKYYFPTIDTFKPNEIDLINKLSALNKDKEVEDVLNILNQNLQDLNTSQKTYTHLGRHLTFYSLGRAEKVLLMSCAAKLTNTPIYLKNDIKSLTKTTLRKYYKQFKDCDYINLIVENNDSKIGMQYRFDKAEKELQEESKLQEESNQISD